jgi:hypothetical protein
MSKACVSVANNVEGSVFFYPSSHVPSPVSGSGTLNQGDGGVHKGDGVGHAGSDVVEVGTDEEMVVAGLQGGVGNELELKSVLGASADDSVVSQTSELISANKFIKVLHVQGCVSEP